MDIIDWFAEEVGVHMGSYPRTEGVYQLVTKEPVGPVAGFTPNLPINQGVRKYHRLLPRVLDYSKGAEVLQQVPLPY